MTYVYVIRSKTKKYNYVGMTDKPDRRLYDHNNGLNKTTKPYAPFELILLEEYPTSTLSKDNKKALMFCNNRAKNKTII